MATSELSKCVRSDTGPSSVQRSMSSVLTLSSLSLNPALGYPAPPIDDDDDNEEIESTFSSASKESKLSSISSGQDSTASLQNAVSSSHGQSQLECRFESEVCNSPYLYSLLISLLQPLFFLLLQYIYGDQIISKP